ncbi:VOC family protein [Gordonia westfalica]|uniref:VOC family protein n=1 Tax=Gordonia westfalica TaxID=158898 RepID=A0ABU2GYL4_9ACTN|nr:VOC family protein [Gordonia westfalica]MDS1116555.1 VOC family protein [Gordonia westfalica]
MTENVDTPAHTYRTSHVGLCVSDLAKSLRFYCEGLGFTKVMEYDIDEQIPEVDAPCSLTSTFLEKDGMRVELLSYRQPGVIGTPPTRRNHLGMTHLSFFSEDIDGAAQALCGFGGALIPDTRVGADDPTAAQFVFVADPDGNRVEIMHIPAGTPW